MSKAELEKKYHVIIADDSWYDPIKGKIRKVYKIYSADGCPWENGLRNLAAVEKELKEWSEELRAIATRVVAQYR